MANVSLTVIKSRPTKEGKYIIRVALTHKHKTTYISTPYKVDNLKQWSKGHVVGRGDAATMNKKLRFILDKYQERIDRLPNGDFTIEQVRELITRASIETPTICEFIDQFARSLERQKRFSYANNIMYTREAVAACFGSAIMFENLNIFSIRTFETWLREHGQSDTTISIRISHLKAVVNAAILAGIVSYEISPFAGYTSPKSKVRDINLTLEEFIKFRDMDFGEGRDVRRCLIARDLFLLSFYLGGVNLVDLLTIDFTKNEARFTRSKTRRKAGNEVMITITEEAKAIAAKYLGAGGRLDFGYKFTRYEDFRSMVGKSFRIIRDNHFKPANNLTYYSARKTFVQFGYELGVPLYVLEYAVGQTIKDAHNRPIFNYLKVMHQQADEAIRKIIDYTK